VFLFHTTYKQFIIRENMLNLSNSLISATYLHVAHMPFFSIST